MSNDNNAINEAIKKVVDFFEKKYYYVRVINTMDTQEEIFISWEQ